MNPATREKLEAWLRYYQDLGFGPFYLDRAGTTRVHHVEATSPGISPLIAAPVARAVAHPALRVVAPASLFDAVERVADDSLERIREDLGDCRRCKLCEHRSKIVFGVGNAKAELVFVGEGPGHDEDVQGIPFVGRAGQLLTQMIEAMGLRRDDVYIGNVVKCRPLENRKPEEIEIATCLPFLRRQLAAIAPKVIVCLGAVATEALIGQPVSITRIRGEWLEYEGARLMPTFHPAYLLRNPHAKSDVWRDLQKVMAVLELEPPPKRRI